MINEDVENPRPFRLAFSSGCAVRDFSPSCFRRFDQGRSAEDEIKERGQQMKQSEQEMKEWAQEINAVHLPPVGGTAGYRLVYGSGHDADGPVSGFTSGPESRKIITPGHGQQLRQAESDSGAA